MNKLLELKNKAKTHIWSKATAKWYLIVLALVSLSTLVSETSTSGIVLVLQVLVTSAVMTALVRYVIHQIGDLLTHPVFDVLRSKEIGLASKLKIRTTLFFSYLACLFFTYIFAAEIIISMYNI
jgi:hypothetical protein